MLAKAKVAVVTLPVIVLIGAAAPKKPVASGPRIYLVPLSAEAEADSRKASGLAGDGDASGLVRLRVDLDRKQICYEFSVAHVATPLMAHIHRAPARHDGPSVVTLFTGPGAELQDCLLWTEKWLTAIVSNPSQFYVNLYTTEYPEGALRGQLAS